MTSCLPPWSNLDIVKLALKYSCFNITTLVTEVSDRPRLLVVRSRCLAMDAWEQDLQLNCAYQWD